MRCQIMILSAVSLLVDTALAKALSFQPRGLNAVQGLETGLRRAASGYNESVVRRSASTTSPSAVATASSTINGTEVAAACMTAVSSMTNISNAAGFAGCYNILTWDPSKLVFQADLRLYQQTAATGNFQNISSNEITVMLNFPQGTQYSAIVRRGLAQLHKRVDGTMVQSQQFSLAGSIAQQVATGKLNETLLASLMVPQISLQAASHSTNMTISDSAYFVAGQFTDISQQASQFANPATATAAVTASKGFILPGTSLGIFPTGLIVTSTWTLLFFVAFGLGTIGRYRSRQMYRKRVAGLATRQKV